MFEKLILCIIKILSHVTEELNRAYIETYGDKKLMYEFNEEVKLRKRANKDLYIRTAAGFIGKTILEKDGYIIPPKQAMEMGEIMFEGAQNLGLIDMLNNVIE